MKILFLTQVLPYPLDAGPKVRGHHMLRWLAERHEVTLVSFVRPDDTPDALAHLREICAAVHAVPIRRSAALNVRAGVRGLLTGLPMVIVRDEMAEMHALLRRLGREEAFDAVHADQLSMAGYGLYAAREGQAAGRRPATVLDEHNAIYLLTERMAATERHPLRRLLMRREAAAFRRYEAAMLAAYDAVLAVTEEDRGHLETLLRDGWKVEGSKLKVEGWKVEGSKLKVQSKENLQPSTQASDSWHAGDSWHNLQPRVGNLQPSTRPNLQPSKITVIPICVDPDAVAPVPRAPSGPPTVLHLGTMFWPPNVTGVLWFAREVLPLVHRAVPDARFVVVGKNPPAEVQALAADPHIEVTGYVADVTPYLAAADAFVVPLHAGGGMRVKILDAWLWGLPIVSTPIGAEGIELRNGENILIAGAATAATTVQVSAGAEASSAAAAAAFADAVVRLLTDEALNASLRRNGRAWVEALYGWRAVYRRVDGVYDGLKIED